MSDGVTRVMTLIRYVPDDRPIRAVIEQISPLLERDPEFREGFLRLIESGVELVAFETHEVTAVPTGYDVVRRLVPSEPLSLLLAAHDARVGPRSSTDGVGHD